MRRNICPPPRSANIPGVALRCRSSEISSSRIRVLEVGSGAPRDSSDVEHATYHSLDPPHGTMELEPGAIGHEMYRQPHRQSGKIEERQTTKVGHLENNFATEAFHRYPASLAELHSPELKHCGVLGSGPVVHFYAQLLVVKELWRCKGGKPHINRWNYR